MTLLQLFLSFLQVGLFSVGGGYASIPIIESQAVNAYGWLSSSEFSDLVTIAEMTPGPIAVNAATFVGLRVAGLPGALIATLGCILPAIIILSVVFHFYAKFSGSGVVKDVLASLRPVVTALIAATALTMLLGVLFPSGEYSVQPAGIAGGILFAAALFVMRKFKAPPIPVMFACGILFVIFGAIIGE